jgi:hypothetical protein
VEKMKVCIAVSAAVSYALFLLPANPLRALFYFLLTSALSAIAIVLSARVILLAIKLGKANESATRMIA